MQTKERLTKRINISEIGAGGNLPPQSVEIEELVLGACMLEKSSFDRTTLLKPEHFYMDANQYIFQAFHDLSSKSYPIDIGTVVEQLKSNGHLEIVGGLQKIAQLTSKISSAANIEYHCALIYQKWGLRELIRISGQVIQDAYNDSTDLFTLQSTLMSEVDKITPVGGREAVSLKDAVDMKVAEIEQIQKMGIKVSGIDTGFKKLNDITHGWQKSDLIILAARPGQGKSAMAVNIVLNVARQKKPIAIFSLEMSLSQLTERAMSIETGIGNSYFKRADLTGAEWNIVANTDFKLPVYIDDSPNLSIFQLKSKARRMKKKYGIEMIVLDYLQLADGEKGKNREQEVGSISRGLKLLAKELDIPVLALAQLSREAEKASGRPILSHLRESGSIEQDADMVMFLYDPLSDDKTIDEPIIETIIAKYRHGAVGIKKMKFKKSTQKIEDYYE